MNYGRLVFAVAVLGLAACSNGKQNGVTDKASKISASAVVEPVGTFKKFPRAGAGADKVFLTINGDSVTSTTVCKVDGQVAKVEVTSAATVSSSHFDVLTSGQKIEMIGDVPCIAELKSGVTAFEVKGNELYLAAEGQESSFFGYRAGETPSLKDRIVGKLAVGGQVLEDGNQWLNEATSKKVDQFRELDRATHAGAKDLTEKGKALTAKAVAGIKSYGGLVNDSVNRTSEAK